MEIMTCVVCGIASTNHIRLQSDMVQLLKRQLKIQLDNQDQDTEKIEACVQCCRKIFAWSVFNERYKSNLLSVEHSEVSQEKYQFEDSTSSTSVVAPVFDNFIDSNITQYDPDAAIFFPEVKLEVQDGDVFHQTSQPIPQSTLYSLLQQSTSVQDDPFPVEEIQEKKIIQPKVLDLNKHYCGKCDKIFKKAANLRRHQILHLENKPLFYCVFCRAHFSSRQQIKNHIVQKHLDLRKFKCEHCPLVFKRRQHLKRHVNVKHNPNKVMYPCELCGKEFNTIPNKGFHIVRVHTKELTGESYDKTESQGNYQCDICGRKVKTADALKRHQLLHSENKPTFECKECGKMLSRQDKLKQHMKTSHSGNAPLPCEVCGKHLPTMSSLKRHRQLHSANRPLFPCPYCGKFYSSTESRCYHIIQVHSDGQGEVLIPKGSQPTEPKSRECHICGKVMVHYKSLKGHLQRHEKDNKMSTDVLSSKDINSS